MKGKLIAGSLAGAALIGGLAFTPMVANAQTALQHRFGSGNGVALQGEGAGNGKGYQSSLESRAAAVNMTADQLREALQTQTMDQIMADKDITTDEYQSRMAEASRARWESRGLSAEEVQKRVEWQQNRHENATHDGTGNLQGGYGRQNR